MKLEPRVQQGAALLASLCVLFAATIGLTKYLNRPAGPAPATPEQIIAQEVAANPALVSREACIRLAILPLPAALQNPDRTPLPTEAEAKAHPDKDLRNWLSRFNPPLATMPMNHDQLVMAVMDTMPMMRARSDAFKAKQSVELRQIDVYKGICAKTSPARDRLAERLFSMHRAMTRALHF
ncbi:hypothetical protein HT749_15535 [Burkholderia cepacia]|uniref:hypothetical protein n=1 Tax=Burkholderia cepacia TaxID=292 RepID=UPI00157A9D53|nr:hypothetical protein [Burkholderia cepacia]NTX44818.1 hypothetical protein [Burkholderia cepacia]